MIVLREADVVAGLISIWREVLDGPEVKVDSDFFALGGDSLKMMTMLFRVSETFGLDVTPDVVFENPVLERFAAHLAAAKSSSSDGEISSEVF